MDIWIKRADGLWYNQRMLTLCAQYRNTEEMAEKLHDELHKQMLITQKVAMLTVGANFIRG